MSLPSSIKIAPGPPGHFLLGNLLAFRRDVLKLLLESQRQYGDVVRFRLGPMIVHLLSHPGHIKHVLIANQHNYNKDTRSSGIIRSVTGPGLLTSSGDFWLRQRRLTQPPFQPRHLPAFTDIMTQATAGMLERWHNHASAGQPIDVASEMMRLTYTIVGKSLFGADVTTDLDTVERAAAIILEQLYHRLEKIVELPQWVPTPRNLRFRRALRTLDQIVLRIIHQEHTRPKNQADLLSLLLHRRDEETGQGMSETQLRNETITLLLAGHETTANALTWTWYLLAQHPEVERQVRAEVSQVIGQRVPTFADLAKLEYTTRVIKESMRLYPPIWIMERRVLGDDVIDSYRIPRGSSVVLCPYVMHRHADFWDEPERFDPERFRPERVEQRHPNAYVPFGTGQRLCIGNHFAMMEAQIILAMVMRTFRLELVPGCRVLPKPGITLRSRDGLRMTLHDPVSPA